MILIADSGSTNAAWYLISPGEESTRFETEGYNPYYVNQDYIIQSLKKSLPVNIHPTRIREVHFYGAGCMLDKTPVIENALQVVFPEAKVHAAIDLLAAARALLGREPGFAAILGTGTNTCVYDGDKIVHNIDSLGYMLGDEGSGTYIGKKLLQEYLRDFMPAPVRDKFREYVGLTFDEIMDRVYNQSLSNRFCAGFAEFAGENIRIPYLYGIVKSAFIDFFSNLVSQYPHYQQYRFNCLGSVGYYFKDILEEVTYQFKMPLGKIIQSPMEGLALYHAG